MLPVWFINTIADILHKQEPSTPAMSHADAGDTPPIPTAKGFTLIQSTKNVTGEIEKVDESMPIRRIRRAVESQLLQEFGLGFIQKLSVVTKQTP